MKDHFSMPSSNAGGRRLGAGLRRDPDVKPTKVISLDAPAAWQDTPAVEGQMGKRGQFKRDRVEVVVLDLSRPADLQRYNDLLSKEADPMANFFFAAHERTFCRGTQNWKILLQVQYVKFRSVIQSGSRPNIGSAATTRIHEETGSN